MSRDVHTGGAGGVPRRVREKRNEFRRWIDPMQTHTYIHALLRYLAARGEGDTRRIKDGEALKGRNE